MGAHEVAPSPSPSPSPALAPASAPARTEPDGSRPASSVACPPPHDSQRPPSAVLVLHSLPPRAFALVWLVLLAARVTCALFLLAMSRVYTALTEECMAYYANLLSPNAPTLFPAVAWTCIAVSAGHWFAIAKTLAVSLKARSLLFGNHSTATVTPAAAVRPDIEALRTSAKASLCNVTRRRLPLLHRWTLADVYRAIFGRQGFFGAESAFFEGQFLLREAFEMGSHTAQVMLGSVLIGRPWINNTLVSVLFVNSWSTPAIQHWTRHRPALERVLCLASDFALDAIMNMALPTLLLTPYYRKYDADNCSFDAALLYSDVGMVNFVMESRMVLVGRPVDLAFKIAPHLSMFLCLRSIQALLRPQQWGAIESKEAPTLTANQSSATDELVPTQLSEHDESGPRAELLPFGKEKAKVPRRGSMPLDVEERRRLAFVRMLSLRIRHMQSRRLRGSKARVVHGVFLLWGALIFGIHVRTSFKPNVASEGSPTGCVQPLRPWFAALPACSVFRYSCLADKATSPVSESLRAIDPDSLASLVLLDCSALTMPPVLQYFPNLMQFEIWRSHIEQWGRDAAITAAANPNVFYCGLIQTTMHEIPAGLRHDLPPSLQDIEISHCNVTALPDDIGRAWARVGTLYMEHCDLREFPKAVERMAIDDLSFAGNDIAHLPPSVMPSNVYSVALSGNPLAEIAYNTLPIDGQLTFLALEDTLVDAIPSWVQDMAERAGGKVFMHGTPFCASKSTEEVSRHYGVDDAVTCANSNPRSNGRYPLDLVIALREDDI